MSTAPGTRKQLCSEAARMQLCSEAELPIFSPCRLESANCLFKPGDRANWEDRERDEKCQGKME